jgi:hypothetical protein
MKNQADAAFSAFMNLFNKYGPAILKILLHYWGSINCGQAKGLLG